MVAATCQAEGCSERSSSGTAFCGRHQTDFRWHRGDSVIHCTAPGQYLVVHKWNGSKKTLPTFEEAEAFALRRKRA